MPPAHRRTCWAVDKPNTGESDAEFTVSSPFFAREHARTNPATFRYIFSKSSNDPRRQAVGAFRAAEIPYVFNGRTRLAQHFDATELAGTISIVR